MLPNAGHTSMVAMLALFALAFISGCNSYQLGNPVELPFESIYIKPVSNDSFAPQAQALLSTQIRDVFIRDGRTKLVTSREAADAVLLINLTDYKRYAAARQSEDTTRQQLSNCKIYSGEEHAHTAQQPQKIDFEKLNNKNVKR